MNLTDVLGITSVEGIHKFYEAFSKAHGFAIGKGNVNVSSKSMKITRAQYHCTRAGFIASHQLNQLGCFLRSHLFAGMTTTQRSESFNALFNGRLGSKTLLMEFVTELDRIMKSRREALVKDNSERKMRNIENHPSMFMANGYK
ncbi:hypothetical protein PsorP6_000912 [Peronosclerospora sorghi]|uniref:Uncharacterized protein n=1 Tax=Peronosclerospora sorghi TaxID=230839 RepID=A0ACC0WXK0_9STRA|nr:hypothetical protein PsorP6_000912 [Peronosclerospora sorghi]